MSTLVFTVEESTDAGKEGGGRKVGRDANAVVGGYRVARLGQGFRRWDTGDSEWGKNPS